MQQTEPLQAPSLLSYPLPTTPNGLVKPDEPTESDEQIELTQLRKAVLEHLSTIGLSPDHQANGSLSKESIRSVHRAHRLQAAHAQRDLLRRRGERLLTNFAEGSEV